MCISTNKNSPIRDFDLKRKGFSLIELMIVIAVVAILATFILVALQGARNAAENSRRISAITSTRSFASIYYAINGTYHNLESAPELLEVLGKYGEEGGEQKVFRIFAEGGPDSNYCAEIQLVKGGYLCTDKGLEIIEGHSVNYCNDEDGGRNCNP